MIYQNQSNQLPVKARSKFPYKQYARENMAADQDAINFRFGFNKFVYNLFFGFCLVKPERTHLSVDADITNAVKFDSSVKFNCTADSHPGVDEYRFYRDQSLLGSNNTGIYHLQLQRSGSYSCVPVNSAGSGEKATLYIAVKGETFRIYCPQMHVYVLTTGSLVYSEIRHFLVTFCVILKRLFLQNHSYRHEFRVQVHFHANQTCFHKRSLQEDSF